MLRIALCDDEEKHLNQTAALLAAYLRVRPRLNGQVECFQSGGELLARAEDERRRRINSGCTGCESCRPCPAGVDIPENFSLWNKLAKCRDASLLWRSWNVVLKDEAKGKHCGGCGRCEAVCPQHLPIRADLVRAQAALDSVPRP